MAKKQSKTKENIELKDTKEGLAFGFFEYEFICKCENCQNSYISRDLIEALDKFSRVVRRPMRIVNGYCCNDSVGNISCNLGGHNKGKSIDLKIPYMDVGDLKSVAIISGFNKAEFCNGFLHLSTE